MSFFKFILIAIWVMMALPAGAMDHSKPLLLEDDFYKEYWEQHFLFDDGTFFTSQFLVANFPWPVGRDHGIMIATLVTPDGKRTIIKNGRDLGEWGFDKEKLDIFLHTHRMKNEDGKHIIHVGKKGYNQFNATVSSAVPVLDHQKFKSKKGRLDVAFYLPYFAGDGKWQVRPDEAQPFETGAGNVQGFASHVIFTDRVENLLKSWLRISGLRGEKNQPVPFLSSMERADGNRDIILTLKDQMGNVTRFPEVRITYKAEQQADNGLSFPGIFKISAWNDADKLSGTFNFRKKIDHFNINDHLNFFEKSFASTRASVANYRYITEYNLTYTSNGMVQKLNGKALGEYKDILPPKAKKKKKKKRGRR